MNQGMGRVNEFIRAFRERLIDCRWQDRDDHVQTSDRFSMYRSFNSILHGTKTYITMNIDRHLKRIMTKFRFDVIELSVHYYRIEIIEGFEMSIMQKKIIRKMRFTLFCVALC